MNFTVYKASAGSGKTYTLVKEFLKLSLASPHAESYKGILAITFTNKAASEMKERVINSLKIISGDKKPEGTPAFLLNDLVKELNTTEEIIKTRSAAVLTHILHNYSDLSICTIDKFTHKIIRTFAHDLHLPVNFEIELDEKNLLSKAVDLLISKVGVNPEFTEVLVEFTESKANQEKDWHIERDLRKFAGEMLGDDGSKYLEKLKHLKLSDFIDIKNQIKNYTTAFENELALIGDEATMLIDSVGVEPAAFAGGANGIPKYFSYLKERRTDNYKPTPTVAKNIEADKWHAGKATINDKSDIDSIKDLLKDFFYRADFIVSERFAEYFLLKMIYKYIYSLMVLNEIEKIIAQLKKENNILHISEFNKIISEIVANEPAPFIYERIGERYKHFLIDEFQDTSVLQWQNLLPLLDNSLAGGNFNMIVGDGKQSIYRWRGGEVEQFAMLPKVYKQDSNLLIAERQASLERNYIEKPLSSNFRSKMEVVDFNNRFFNQISTGLFIGYQTIYDNHNQNFRKENQGGYVQVEFLDEKNLAELSLEQTNCIKIHEIINDTLLDGYKLKDIAILFRKNQEASLVARFLIEQGIDVISSESLLINNSKDVRFAVNFLSYLINPADIGLQAKIMQFVLLYKIKNQSEIHNSLSALRPSQLSLEKQLSAKGYVFSSVRLLKLPLYEICEEIFRIFELSEKPNSYIQFFLESVHNFTARNTAGIVSFLEWWEDKKDKLSVVIPQGTNAVNIMTIHKSKGLEFPIVIFPFANWRTKNSKDNFWINLDKSSVVNLSSAVVPANKQLEDTVYAPLYSEEVNKSKLDNMNILYVAMTRPEDRLYIISSLSKYKDLANYFIDYFKAAGQWDCECNTYTFGTKTPSLQRVSKDYPSTYLLDSIISEPWNNKINITRLAPERWDIENLDEQMAYGKLLHLALSRINSIVQIEPVLERMVFEGIILSEEKVKLENKLLQIVTHPKIALWFSPLLNVKNEVEILLPDGSSYRPDKVIIQDKNAVIIDFKTGKRNLKKHSNQLDKYQEVLIDMGFESIQKYLIYTEEIVVEQLM
ncbi:MAG: UvrD-helicase domain-containing protein [Bacteroidetes bacterium]|nr:UvrD-helicase domain-containing protein [Bacteroidota bacterium]HET6245123.1 UvrD-helicase domain-containing protein [Bacteroidia bacterium]